MEKAKIREVNKLKRAEMVKIEVNEKSEKIADYILSGEIYKNSASVMLYMPIGNEVKMDKIINRAYLDSKKVVFPVTDEKNNITPHYARRDTQFSTGLYSVQEPDNSETARLDEIDIVIVPGIAFDRKGNRVGFGKGCYDGFLRDVNAVKIGVCYEFQICHKIFADPYDIKMDYIICEKGIIKVNK